MRYIISFFFFTLFLHASLFDFYYLEKAEQAYKDKNYTIARDFYKKIDNDEAKFKIAQTFYYQKKYQEAIDTYQNIDELNLQSKKLYNMGNIYAKLKQLDNAISSYEESLKIKEDKDCRFNLELLKKKKKEEEKKRDKKKDKKDNKNKKDDKNKKDSKEKKDDKNKKESDKKKSDEEKDKEKKEAEKKEAEKNKKKEDKKKQQKQINEQNKTQPPITDMEERKWHRMLNQRGVNTLMIPLNKGKKNNETTSW